MTFFCNSKNLLLELKNPGYTTSALPGNFFMSGYSILVFQGSSFRFIKLVPQFHHSILNLG